MPDSRSLSFYRSPAFWLGLCFSFVLVLPFAVRLQPTAITQLEIDVWAEKPDTLEIYWDLGNGYRAEVVSASRIGGGEVWQSHCFIVPMQHVKRLRLDPVASDQEVTIRSITLYREGEAPEVIPWTEMNPLAAVEEMRVEQDMLIVVPQIGANDPQLSMEGKRFNRGICGQQVIFHLQPMAYVVWIAWMAGACLIGRMSVVFLQPAGTPLSPCCNETRKVLLWGTLILISLLIACGLVRWLIWTGWLNSVEEPPILEVGMVAESESAEFSQLFYDTGRGFNEGQTEIISLMNEKTGDHRSVFFFQLPVGAIHSLRWDPINAAGDIQISSVYLQWRDWRVALSLNRLFPQQDLDFVMYSECGVHGITPEGGSDPSLLIREYLVFPVPGKGCLLLSLRVTACLSIIGVWLVLLWVWDGPRRNLLLRQA